MLTVSQAQMDLLRKHRIATFLRRVHEHQRRVGLVQVNTEFNLREKMLRDCLECALAHGFKEERHLMLAIDCMLLFGPGPVSKRLSGVTGNAERKAAALMELD